MLRRLVTVVLGGTAVLLLLAAVAAVLLLPSATPTVPRSPGIEVTDVERALSLARSHDPRRALPGVVRTLRLSGHEAELLLNQAAARLGAGAWQVDVAAARLWVRGSVPLPRTPLGHWWLNVDVVAHATRGLPQLQSVRLGRLPLPVGLVEWAVAAWAERHGLGGDVPVLTVHRLGLQPQRVDALYAWGPDAPTRLLGVLLPAHERDRLRQYARRLAAISTADGAPQRSLADVMPPLFALARQRSDAGQDPALENRAALLVLGLAANGVGWGTLLPERRGESVARPLKLTLAGRTDFPQHLLVSAAVAVDSGTGMADLLGLYKEMADARSGSGFSFNDIAANRAGTRLGELAMRQPLRVQARLASPKLAESDFMPDVADLPEFMREADFRARYGDPSSAAYRQMMADIERRLQITPLFRP